MLRPEESWVRLLGTGVGRRTTEQAIRQNLRAARASVDLTMSEIGRTNALRDLIEAHRTRGVSVRVLVDPQDMTEYLPALLGPLRRRWPKAVLNALAVRTLLDAGVAVRYFAVGGEFALLHMKAAVFDNARAIVGSTNWTRGGFEWVGETDVELHGGSVIDTLQKRFGTDWERATPAPIPSRSVQILSQIYEHLIQNGSYARADGLQ
jgi:phosphatidylserine/phosphatidylglycerophosphate/cardiolipin synthase-like enzyme